MTVDALAENPRAIIGGNSPPLTPYEDAEKAVNDIYGECRLWLDGAVVDSQDLADGIGNLLADLRAAETKAEAARVAEKKPFDEKIAEIQARYDPLIADKKSMKGKTTLAIAACKKALQPWLEKKDAELREQARLASEEADAKQRAAQDALRAAQSIDLAAREAAEELVRDAKKAETKANAALRQTAAAGGAVGRAASLRTVWVAVVEDPIAFGKFAWARHREEYGAFLQGLANRLVRGGARSVPGVVVTETKQAV